MLIKALLIVPLASEDCFKCSKYKAIFKDGIGNMTSMLLSLQKEKNFLRVRQYLLIVDGFLESQMLEMILPLRIGVKFSQQGC